MKFLFCLPLFDRKVKAVKATSGTAENMTRMHLCNGLADLTVTESQSDIMAVDIDGLQPKRVTSLSGGSGSGQADQQAVVEVDHRLSFPDVSSSSSLFHQQNCLSGPTSVQDGKLETQLQGGLDFTCEEASDAMEKELSDASSLVNRLSSFCSGGNSTELPSLSHELNCLKDFTFTKTVCPLEIRDTFERPVFDHFGSSFDHLSKGSKKSTTSSSSHAVIVPIIDESELDNYCYDGTVCDLLNHFPLQQKFGSGPDAGGFVGRFRLQNHNFSQSRVQEWLDNIPSEISIDNDEILAHVPSNQSHLQDTKAFFVVEDVIFNAAVRSLNVQSTVAHLAGIGLRELPSLGAFSHLKRLNLSANCITQVAARCLPGTLQSLDLSRNKLVFVDGLKELTRLRVLNLSHNCICRLGHGLSNCVHMKELYLEGNKLAEVEGLHRLLKLSVLDLSWNNLATTNAIGQLAANCRSLVALNLLGNPVIVNVGGEQLRKLVSILTPNVIYLNKQPIKNAVSIEASVTDSFARAALGLNQQCSMSATTRARPRTRVKKKASRILRRRGMP